METEEEILFNDYLVKEVFPKEGMCEHGNYQKTCRVCDDKKIKVLCAMSGGVDSSVAAALLKKQGREVIGVFLKFTRKTENCPTNDHQHFSNICCDQEALRSARSVAFKLKIPFYVFDVNREFKKEVVDYYIAEYDSGRTPNPCVVCNKKIKFGWLIKKAKELGCEFVATGHYARLRREILNPKSDHSTSSGRPEENRTGEILNKSKIQNPKLQTVKLLKAVDEKKDQSYFLWQLSQDQLKYILFPIGEFTKKEVRRMARKWKLPTAEKSESQDICFVPDGDNGKFLHQYAKKLIKSGNTVDKKGNVLGRHQGLINYTIGQRHGLGGIQLIAKNQKLKAMPLAAFVLKLDVEKNELVVDEEKELFSKKLTAKDINWLADNPPKFSLTYQAKIRYGAKEAKCKIHATCYVLHATFESSQRAITPGQSVVIYDDRELLGGGIIL